MNRERFARLKALVLAAAEKPATERAAFLVAACGEDEELRRQAAAMIEREEATGEDALLSRCDDALAKILAEPGDLAAVPTDADPPRRIDAYEIHEELGRGGMGVVFRAEQTEPLRRQVALKLLPPGQAGARAVRRFAAERQALALMEHANIARVYDAGETPDSRPYFVMELVPGLSITRYCAEHHLDLADRLRLMLPVCDAVQHAHQKGVVHRDLKPSNILVAESNGTPHPKVIDFGIAKADAELVSGGATLTLEGQLLGTLEYMSPEQVAGSPDVDTRTDVYSLGVVLYTLIAGKPPHALRDVGLAEAIRMIQEQAPRPLTVSAPENRRIDADLRTIVTKALAKSADERYASAAALGDDLRRYLSGQPIAARPLSTAYQLRKLVGRHRLPAALMATLVVVLAIFGVTMLALFGAQRVQRQRAEAEADKATAVVDFLVGMLGSANPGEEGRDVTVHEVLGIAADDLRNSFDDQPAVSANVHRTLGVTYRALGLYDAAELHLRTAFALRDSLHPTAHRDRLESLDDLAGFLMEMGDFATADTLYGELLEHARRRADSDPIAYANALNNAARINQDLGRLEEAAAMLRESIAVDQGLRADEDPSRTAALNNLATVLTQLGHYTEAEIHMRAALAISETQHVDNHPDLVTERSNLAKIWHRLGRYDEAATLYRRIQPTLVEIYDASHPRVAIGRINLAMVLQDRGELDRADSLFAVSVEPLREIMGPDHPYSAITLAYLGLLRRAQGDLPAADELLTRGCELLTAARGEESPHLATMLQHLAGVRHAHGDTTAAAAQYQRALKIWNVVADSDDHPSLAAGRYGLGCLLLDQGDTAGAESLLRRAREALLLNLPPQHRGVALANNAYGAALIRLDRVDEGAPLLATSQHLLLADPGLEPHDRAVIERRSRLLDPVASR